MLIITNRAINEINNVLREGEFLRISVDIIVCSFEYYLRINSCKECCDTVLYSRVLVGKDSLKYLTEATLDYVSNSSDSGFHFINPLAANTCSFGNARR